MTMSKVQMKIEELEAFMHKYGFDNESLAGFLGITKPAVDHWTSGRRAIPPTTVRLLKFFAKHPELMDTFENLAIK